MTVMLGLLGGCQWHILGDASAAPEPSSLSPPGVWGCVLSVIALCSMYADVRAAAGMTHTHTQYALHTKRPYCVRVGDAPQKEDVGCVSKHAPVAVQLHGVYQQTDNGEGNATVQCSWLPADKTAGLYSLQR